MPIPTHIAREIARLMRDPDALRHERGRLPLAGRHGRYDPNQPRVPAGESGGGQWTDTDREGAPPRIEDGERPQLAQFSPDRSPVRPPVRPPAVPPRRGAFGVLAALFAIWSARNTPERRAVFEFNAREYLKDPSGNLVEANVDRLNREQVRNACPGLKEVHDRTDEAVRDVRQDGGSSMSSQQFGTAVHKRLKDLIDGDRDTNLQAEVSRVKSEEEKVDYGTKDSVRIDVLECAPARTVCVHDIKTGNSRSSGLGPARMYELAMYAFKACPATERVVVTEVRPSQ